MARHLAAAVATGVPVGPGFVRAEEARSDREGQVLLNVSHEFPFVVWHFEQAVIDGPGFPYLDKNGNALKAIAKREKVPQSKGQPPRPPVAVGLPTFELRYLGARSLAGVAGVLFPYLIGRDEVFEELKSRMEQVLNRSGANAVSLGVVDEKRGARIQHREDAWEKALLPFADHGRDTRLWLRRGAVAGSHGGADGGGWLPVWLPWPDGFRDARRDGASLVPRVEV